MVFVATVSVAMVFVAMRASANLHGPMRKCTNCFGARRPSDIPLAVAVTAAIVTGRRAADLHGWGGRAANLHGGAHGEGVRQICTGALVCGRSACVCAHGAACGKSARSVRSLGRLAADLHRHVASVVAVVVVAIVVVAVAGACPPRHTSTHPTPLARAILSSTPTPLRTHTSLARTPP